MLAEAVVDLHDATITEDDQPVLQGRQERSRPFTLVLDESAAAALVLQGGHRQRERHGGPGTRRRADGEPSAEHVDLLLQARVTDMAAGGGVVQCAFCHPATVVLHRELHEVLVPRDRHVRRGGLRMFDDVDDELSDDVDEQLVVQPGDLGVHGGLDPEGPATLHLGDQAGHGIGQRHRDRRPGAPCPGHLTDGGDRGVKRSGGPVKCLKVPVLRLDDVLAGDDDVLQRVVVQDVGHPPAFVRDRLDHVRRTAPVASCRLAGVSWGRASV